MKQKNVILGRLLMTFGSMLILGGLLLFAYNHKLECTAEEVSNSTLLAVQQKVEQNRAAAGNKRQPIQQLELGGTRYLGVLTVPSLDLVLPVQADWDYEKLCDTPCVYSGSIQNGELVILAHNYRSHFGRIDHLRQGDEIKLTDAVGNEFHYLVEELLVLDATNVDEMTDSGYDLSLFTCTYGGKARVTVRCTLQNEADRYPVV